MREAEGESEADLYSVERNRRRTMSSLSFFGYASTSRRTLERHLESDDDDGVHYFSAQVEKLL